MTDRPGPPIRAGHSRWLAWVFLLLLLGGVLVVYEIAETAQGEVASPGPITRLLARSTPDRPRPGRAAPAAAERAADAASPAPPAAVEATPLPTVAPTPTQVPDRFRVANTEGAGRGLP